MAETDRNITDPHPDFLSPLAMKILAERRESAYQQLVVRGATPDDARKLLGSVKPSDLLSIQIKAEDEAQAVLAALWLWLDGLDEAHKIVQDLIGPTGAFWHAIMHRREGDFSNSKYWYHRCPHHHVMRMLGAVCSSVVAGYESNRQVQHIVSGGWNPDALVDLVEHVNRNPSDPRFDLAVKLQRAEWTGLFEYCVHAAVEADYDGLDAWDKRVNP